MKPVRSTIAMVDSAAMTASVWRPAAPPFATFGATVIGTSGGSWQILIYRAVNPGEETVHLVEARPWEPENITGRYSLVVRISPAP